MDELSSLPRRPMTMQEVKELGERDGVERAQPVHVADGEETLVVGLLLLTQKMAVGAGYDADERRWLQVAPKSIASLGSDRARSEALEELAEWCPAPDATGSVWMGIGSGEVDPTFDADDGLTATYHEQYELRSSTVNE